jgi:hypothetical protein
MRTDINRRTCYLHLSAHTVVDAVSKNYYSHVRMQITVLGYVGAV